jgi:osmotically-inducible protein OsmY
MRQDPTPEPSANDILLADAVRDRLSATGYQELRRLDVDVADGHVKLSGRVARYYLLQLAQKAAMDAEGVLELRNVIEVIKQPHHQ